MTELAAEILATLFIGFLALGLLRLLAIMVSKDHDPHPQPYVQKRTVNVPNNAPVSWPARIVFAAMCLAVTYIFVSGLIRVWSTALR